MLSWRYAFFLLAGFSAALAYLLHHVLPEPARGGHSWLFAGDRDADATDNVARSAVERAGVRPVDSRVLHTDPAKLSLWRAAWYLLRIPTIRILIVASSVGYFFFAGVRTFAIVFAQLHFDLALTTLSGLVPLIGLGALAGLIAGGRLTDTALSRGYASVRVVVPAVAYSVAALLFAPAIVTTSLMLALPLFTAGAAALAAANPPLDAARLDIVSGRLWGRAESIRTVLRLAAEAFAPVTFGITADLLGGPSGRTSATGLRNAFLIMLVPLLLNGLLVWVARRTYPSDVATAAASDAGERASVPGVGKAG